MIESGLAYTRNELNVHEIVLHDVRITTLAAFSVRLKSIIAETPQGETLRIILTTPAIPSIQYMVGIARDIREKSLNTHPARIAVLYAPTLQLSLLSVVIRAVVRSSTLKLFLQKDEQQAREWLLKDK